MHPQLPLTHAVPLLAVAQLVHDDPHPAGWVSAPHIPPTQQELEPHAAHPLPLLPHATLELPIAQEPYPSQQPPLHVSPPAQDAEQTCVEVLHAWPGGQSELELLHPQTEPTHADPRDEPLQSDGFLHPQVPPTQLVPCSDVEQSTQAPGAPQLMAVFMHGACESCAVIPSDAASCGASGLTPLSPWTAPSIPAPLSVPAPTSTCWSATLPSFSDSSPAVPMPHAVTISEAAQTAAAKGRLPHMSSITTKHAVSASSRRALVRAGPLVAREVQGAPAFIAIMSSTTMKKSTTRSPPFVPGARRDGQSAGVR